MKRVMPFIVLALLIAAGVSIVYYVGSRPAGTSPTAVSDADTIAAADWVTGNKNAKVVLIEYSDFQCPACGAYHPLVKQLLQDLGTNIAFVYHHFPLSQHQHAKLAASAAEAAGKQGKFWEMHDMLFDHQRDWSDASNARDMIIGYAATLGLDRAQFEKDLDNGAIAQKISDSYRTGMTLGIEGTPTFFLDGKKMTTPHSYDEFKRAVQDEIAAKK